ncbi:MAG: sulfurtransferase TusA family protein [Candidatus Heimdallarchaeota archaeon]|nr:MAG: hypothetical protein DRP02_12080 [Candidatus Gerdarchaeota archaeon]RLI69706.1 MAG: hypothetical protein DRO91_07575 [Candidatus Heimdallarchaeota archaeon]
MKDEQFDHIHLFINAMGVKCPIPSMKVRLSMPKVPPGGIVKVITEAPHSAKSIPRYCQNFGHDLLLFEEKNGVFTFIIQKKKK